MKDLIYIALAIGMYNLGSIVEYNFGNQSREIERYRFEAMRANEVSGRITQRLNDCIENKNRINTADADVTYLADE